MKKEILLIIFAFVFIFSIANSSAVYVGLVDGYIFNHTGGTVSGATVTITVSGCTGGAGNGCTGSTTSESDGYYIVPNLNVAKLGSYSASATKGGGSGSSGGTTDNFYIGHTNITLCYSPSAPSLTAVPSAHNTTAIFAWTSGSDPYGRSQHDEFNIDASITNPAFSPITRTGLLTGSHTWQVRTCNDDLSPSIQCCSSFSSNVFSVINNAPTTPSNANASANGDNTTSVSWTSGTDADGDATYDVFKYANGTEVSNIHSPFNISTTTIMKWSVKTCDSFGACSAYLDTESVNCNATTSCATCPVCNGGGGGGGSNGNNNNQQKCETPTPSPSEGNTVELLCNGIPVINATLLRIKMNVQQGKAKISFYGINYNFEDLEYCPWCYNGKKDYDEEAVDCGGSCRACSKLETKLSPVVEKYIPWQIIVPAIVIGIGAAAFLAYRLISLFFYPSAAVEASEVIRKREED